MLPDIYILGREIPMYGIMAMLGIFVAAFFGIFHFSKYYDVKKDDVFYCILFALIGVGIGAKVLYIITIIPSLPETINNLGLKEAVSRIMQGGFVFYGGLIGGILGILVYSKIFKVSFKKLIFILVPTTPILHSIGRIGCLCAGCCYGQEYHGFGHIVFHSNKYSTVPIGMEVFPTQIVESIVCFIIFILILITYKRFKGTYKSIALYSVLYSVARFIIEFYRADSARGIILGLSTSQWISIVLFVIGIVLFVYSDNKKELKKDEV